MNSEENGDASHISEINDAQENIEDLRDENVEHEESSEKELDASEEIESDSKYNESNEMHNGHAENDLMDDEEHENEENVIMEDSNTEHENVILEDSNDVPKNVVTEDSDDMPKNGVTEDSNKKPNINSRYRDIIRSQKSSEYDDDWNAYDQEKAKRNSSGILKAMSTKVKVVDSEALNDAIREVRSDTGVNGRKAWVLVGHVDNNPNAVNLIAKDTSDSANTIEFCDKLKDDQVMYGLLRLNTTVDMSNTVKFVYVKWIGDNVPYAKRGRYGVVSGNVEEQFGSSHAAVETGNKEDLIEEELIKTLEESSFTRSKVLVDVEGRQERGFTQHSYQSTQHGYQANKPKYEKTSSRVPAAAVVEVTSEVSEAIAEVRDDQNSIRWLLCGFEDGNLRKPLILYDKGEGDINSLKEKIEDDKVMYGLYRSSDMIDDISTVKFVYFSWVGPEVKPMIRGKVSTFAGPVEKIFNAHVSLLFYNKHEIGEHVIIDKVKASSGSKLWVKS